jgi:hypothetical protein
MIQEAVAQKIASIVYNSYRELGYPAEWSDWRDPIACYIFQVKDGNVERNQMSSLGYWWRLLGSALVKTEGFSDCDWKDGIFLIPVIKFFQQDDRILTQENYGDSLSIRRRCSMEVFNNAHVWPDIINHYYMRRPSEGGYEIQVDFGEITHDD